MLIHSAGLTSGWSIGEIQIARNELSTMSSSQLRKSTDAAPVPPLGGAILTPGALISALRQCFYGYSVEERQ
jgi:hypothetical protein